MNIGPIQLRWTKTVKREQAAAQKRDLRQNRCIAGQYHDIQALRTTIERWKPFIVPLVSHRHSREAKTPKGAGASI